MFPHEEHLYLTLASLLASSSPSVPPSAGARSFSTRSVSPARESREALPRGRQHSHTAGFSCHHEVFRSCWQLPPLPLQQCPAALPPSRLPLQLPHSKRVLSLPLGHCHFLVGTVAGNTMATALLV